MFPQQQATCTKGPSLPSIKPALVDSIIPIDLINNVHFPKYPRMMKPPRMVLICLKIRISIIIYLYEGKEGTSGIPLPLAYGANTRTNKTADRPNVMAQII